MHSTCVAPASTPASVFATASPRSLWQCDGERRPASSSGQCRRTSRRNAAYSCGQRVADRVRQVDDRCAGLDRGRGRRSARKSGSERVASSARELDLVDAPARRAPRAPRACSTHLGRREAELPLHVDRARRDEDVKPRAARLRERLDGRVDVLGARAGERRDARPARRTRRRRGRPRSRRATRSAKPASITSTPRRSSWAAISAFSSGCSAMPGDCSPSRSVVSKIVILRLATDSSSSALRSEAHFWCDEVGVCAREARGRKLPLEGENRDDDDRNQAARSQRRRAAEWVSARSVIALGLAVLPPARPICQAGRRIFGLCAPGRASFTL